MTKKLAKVFHAELFGKRNDKFKSLNVDFADIDWKELDVQNPYYFFVPKDFGAMEEYEKGFGINELFKLNTSGIKTHRDELVIDKNKNILKERMKYFFETEDHNNIISNLSLKETKSWNVFSAKNNNSFDENKLVDVLYKPFDIRNIYYDSFLIDRGREEKMKHMLFKKNIGLCLMRSLVNTKELKSVFISNTLMDLNFYGFQTYLFPIYLYHADGTRTANLDANMVKRFADELGMEFVDEYEEEDSRLRGNDELFTPENVLDYMYAVLHSPAYRAKYKEFLKINFPRIPYPKDIAGENGNVNETFEKLVGLGKQIREIHLLESSETENYVTTFPVAGDNILVKKYPKFVVSKKDEHMGNVYINETQYFGNVPKSAWEFYIGGYQPAQKWLKDRKETQLSFEDLLHWQKIIVALHHTEKLMKTIDETLKI